MIPRLTRRRLVVAAAASVAAAPAFAEDCHIGPPPHEKGPRVFLDYDQVELDAAYDQTAYAPLEGQILKRIGSLSAAAQERLGAPQREVYGPSEIEKLDIYRTSHAKAPIFVHGGAWRGGSAKAYAYIAEMFVRAGAHCVALDFVNVKETGGDLRPMAAQVRRAIAWTHQNAARFDGDPQRLYIGGHSSGGHLCAVALVTEWEKEFGLPTDAVKGGLCMSGLYDLQPVRLSSRSSYVHISDEIEHALSPARHIDRLRVPIVVTYGGDETPEFQRQNRDFAAAVIAAGKPAELIEAPHFNHFEMMESIGNPYGPNGRAALKLMGLV
ncbi:MAG TPA: alpha/beta hydrolase [Stellaceae bacterium]|nr:alpha/beta hydrolase [Stellaceae bacterium]